MPTATRFHLLRHAEHTLQGRVLVGRMPGVRLSQAGRTSVARLADLLGAKPIQAVFSSPIGRARDTAGPIAARLGVPVGIEEGLNEIDFGTWTGQAFDALEGLESWQAWNRSRGLASCPGGETMAAAQQRAMTALHRLRGEWPDSDILIVSHADVLKAVLARFLGAPLDLLHRFELSPAHRAFVTMWDDGAVVEAVNLPPPA